MTSKNLKSAIWLVLAVSATALAAPGVAAVAAVAVAAAGRQAADGIDQQPFSAGDHGRRDGPVHRRCMW